MKKSILIAAYLFLAGAAYGQHPWDHGRIGVSPGGHYLQHGDGTPFFWLGDTAWELFHRLTYEQIDHYFADRQTKGFNVIQAVLLAEMDGLTRPNRYGEVPLLNLDPDIPNEKYFVFVDSVIRMAEKRNLYLGLLPTWGDKVTRMWGAGPVVFNAENAFRYGNWLGERYRHSPNILWILGGDRPALNDTTDWRPIWRSMARGIQSGTGNQPFITYHPSGGAFSTSQYIHNEDWLSMNMIQSGHGGGHDVPVWNLITRDRNLKPVKPVLDAEPNYEDHPVNPWPVWNPVNGYYRDYDVRKQIYRSVFSGGCGVTYGHHSVWQFWSPRELKINHADRYWTNALDRPGAFQAGYLKKLMESRPLLSRIPDQSLIISGQGEKGHYLCAFRDSANSFLMVYLPAGKPVTVPTSVIRSPEIRVWWINPRKGTVKDAGLIMNRDTIRFSPPAPGSGNDWVLLADDPALGYSKPKLK